jgi:hypothetical protein
VGASYQQVLEEAPPAAEAITSSVGSTVVAVLSRLVPVASDAAVAEYAVKQPVLFRSLSLSFTLSLAYSLESKRVSETDHRSVLSHVYVSSSSSSSSLESRRVSETDYRSSGE